MATKKTDWPGEDEGEEVVEAPAAPVVPSAADAPATTAATGEKPAAAPVVSQAPAAPVVPARKAAETLKEALDNLKAANALPESTGPQQRAKQVELAAAQKDYHRLANGETVSPLSGDDFRDVVDSQSAAAKIQKLEAFGRKFPEVAELLSENLELKTLLKEAKKPKPQLP